MSDAEVKVLPRVSRQSHAAGVQQLQQALQQQGCSITMTEAASVVRQFDSDGDGLLTFADFTRLMQTTCGDSHSESSGVLRSWQ